MSKLMVIESLLVDVQNHNLLFPFQLNIFKVTRCHRLNEEALLKWWKKDREREGEREEGGRGEKKKKVYLDHVYRIWLKIAKPIEGIKYINTRPWERRQYVKNVTTLTIFPCKNIQIVLICSPLFRFVFS